MNIWTFSGNLGADAILRYTASNKAVTQFNVGISSGYGDNKKTVWARCSVWEKQAELASEVFKKGMRFTGYGEVISDRYEKDGSEKPQLEVRIIGFDLPPKEGSAKPTESKPNEQGSFDDVPDDIPF